MNLAINARDAMRSSGEIRVAMRLVGRVAEVCTSCRKNVEGDMVELSVSDNGPGIAADVQERMFEPFFTTKDVGQGSGMGLSTVHGIVHEHGGHVVVEKVPGAGARFRVLLPALRSQERGGALPRSATRGAALPRASLAGRVAVIDDEASVASFMNDLLAQWGLEVTTFVDARAALDAIAGGAAFDLVITDQTMPGMTGIEFARAARAMRRGAAHRAVHRIRRRTYSGQCRAGRCCGIGPQADRAFLVACGVGKASAAPDDRALIVACHDGR